MGSILIHKTGKVGDVEGLLGAIEDLRAHADVRIEQTRVSAVAGELAGVALDILISQPAQAILNAAAFGALLWKVIELLRKAGKKLLISKDLVLPLAASKAKDDLGEDFSANPESIKIWGPMAASIEEGSALDCLEEYREALGPLAYFMAIAVLVPNNRVKTTYYLLGAGGKVCATWTTQTLFDRVPEFLRPE